MVQLHTSVSEGLEGEKANRYPKLTQTWTSHNQCSVPASTRRVSPALASKPALLSPQALPFRVTHGRCLVLKRFITRLGFRLMGKDQKRVHCKLGRSCFCARERLTLQPANMIEFSMYCKGILPHRAEAGKGREVHEWVRMSTQSETNFDPQSRKTIQDFLRSDTLIIVLT